MPPAAPQGAYLLTLDLAGISLPGAKQRGASLFALQRPPARMRGADLAGARIINDLSDADLSWVDLTGAMLGEDDLRGADMAGAGPEGMDVELVRIGGFISAAGARLAPLKNLKRSRP